MTNGVTSMKIHTIGGYDKIGRNMTAVETNGKIVILDMGADIERIVEQGENFDSLKTIEAIESDVVPDDSQIKNRREDVEAIVVGHGHQDHSLGIPKLAGAYDCPILATPYTGDLIERFIENDREHVKNEIIRMEAGNTIQISDGIELEFVDMTHSIPQAVLPILRTEEGNVAYSLDFKLDEEPTMGEPINYSKLERLGDEGIRAYLADCTRADQPGKTDPEIKAKRELEKIISEAQNKKEGIIVTTFSSHIARLNNILAANNGKRKVVMFGRSLKEYTEDAESRGLIDLSGIEVASYRDRVQDLFEEVSRNKSDYLLIMTGNQGEPNAMLSRVASDEYPYSISHRDLVVFSSVTIPTPINELNREYLKRRLKQRGADIEVDVHSHGHARKEGHKKMLRMLRPETVIPAHGGKEKRSACARLAREEDVDSVRTSENGGVVSLN